MPSGSRACSFLQAFLPFREELKHGAIDCRDIGWSAAGNPVFVPYYFLVDPVSGGIAHVVLNRVIARQGTPANTAGRSQQPGCMANASRRLPPTLHFTQKFLRGAAPATCPGSASLREAAGR